MNNLTLVIPAKYENSTLPIVLEEINDMKLLCKIIVVVPEYDKSTIQAIEKFDCKILIQKGEGFGNALIQGLNESNTKYSCIFYAYVCILMHFCEIQTYLCELMHIHVAPNQTFQILILNLY